MSIKKAALINAMGKYSTIIFQLGVNIILSRILSPDDYGVVAIIMTFSTFFYTLSAMGLSTGIIQHKELTDEDVDAIFSFSVYASFVLAVLFSFLSIFIAKIYENEIYLSLGSLLSISLFLNGINMVPQGIMNREKKFVEIAIRTFVSYGLSAVVAVVLALMGLRYYALVIQNIVSALAVFLWNYISTRPKFRFRVELGSVKKIATYSGFQMGGQIVGYFVNNADNLISGKLLGSTLLGYYNKAYVLANYPINNFSAIISSTLHPILSDYSSEKEKLYTYHLKINRLFAVVGFFSSAACYLMADELIIFLFGKQWISSILAFKILSLTIAFRMMSSALNAIFQSLGRTDLLLKDKLVEMLIIFLFIFGGVKYFGGLFGLSFGVSLAYLCFYLVAISFLCISGFKISLIRHFLDMSREYLLGTILIFSAIVFPKLELPLLTLLLLKGIFIGSVCILLCFIFEREFLYRLLRRKKR